MDKDRVFSLNIGSATSDKKLKSSLDLLNIYFIGIRLPAGLFQEKIENTLFIFNQA